MENQTAPSWNRKGTISDCLTGKSRSRVDSGTQRMSGGFSFTLPSPWNFRLSASQVQVQGEQSFSLPTADTILSNSLFDPKSFTCSSLYQSLLPSSMNWLRLGYLSTPRRRVGWAENGGVSTGKIKVLLPKEKGWSPDGHTHQVSALIAWNLPGPKSWNDWFSSDQEGCCFSTLHNPLGFYLLSVWWRLCTSHTIKLRVLEPHSLLLAWVASLAQGSLGIPLRNCPLFFKKKI